MRYNALLDIVAILFPQIYQNYDLRRLPWLIGHMQNVIFKLHCWHVGLGTAERWHGELSRVFLSITERME